MNQKVRIDFSSHRKENGRDVILGTSTENDPIEDYHCAENSTDDGGDTRSSSSINSGDEHEEN